MAELGEAFIRIQPDMASFRHALAEGFREMADQIDPPSDESTDEATS